HRSTHVGDEYLAEGAFGRNQVGLPGSGEIFGRPPVRRYNLSFESFRSVLSAEGAPRHFLTRILQDQASIRTYVGIEKKFGRFVTHQPANFRSAIYQAGLELRTQGNAHTLHDGWFTKFENFIFPTAHASDSEWLGAIDFKLARPYQFAFADAPAG